MVKNIELIDKCTDKELISICKYSDMEKLLKPMKENSKMYQMHIKQLGSMDRKSNLVKQLLPPVAVKLYKKNDPNYLKAIDEIVGDFYSWSKELLLKVSKKKSIDELSTVSQQEIVDLFFSIRETEKKFAVDVYIIMLKINNISTEDDIEKHIEERNAQQMAIKKQIELVEKELTSEFDKERSVLKKEIDGLKKTIQKISDAKEKAEKQNEQLEQAISELKSHRVEEWEQKLKKDEEDRRRKSMVALDFECDEKRKATEEEISLYRDNQLALVEQEAEKRKESLETELLELEEEINSKKLLLSNLEIETTEKQQLCQNLCRLVENYTEMENRYFESFDERILNRKIDSILFNKFAMPMTSEIVTGDYYISSNSGFMAVFEESQSAQTVQELMEDLQDNLSVYFSNYSEIASILLATIFQHGGIAVLDSVGLKVATSIASLTEYGKPLIIDVLSTIQNINNFMATIRDSEAEVVYLRGVIDRYDDALVKTITREFDRKIILWGASDLSCIHLLSKDIANYILPLDIEKYVVIEKDEPIWKAENNISNILGKISRGKNETYTSTYKKLVEKGVISQSVALTYSMITDAYQDFLETKEIGEILTHTIISICHTKDIDDDELKALCDKCSLHID